MARIDLENKCRRFVEDCKSVAKTLKDHGADYDILHRRWCESLNFLDGLIESYFYLEGRPLFSLDQVTKLMNDLRDAFLGDIK